MPGCGAAASRSVHLLVWSSIIISAKTYPAGRNLTGFGRGEQIGTSLIVEPNSQLKQPPTNRSFDRISPRRGGGDRSPRPGLGFGFGLMFEV